MNRYAVNLVAPNTRWAGIGGKLVEAGASRSFWGIYDRSLKELCGLPYMGSLTETSILAWPFDGQPHTVESSYAYKQANDWLESCYRAWGYVPSAGGPHPKDVDWAEVARAHEEDEHWRKRYSQLATEVGNRVFRQGRDFLIS